MSPIQPPIYLSSHPPILRGSLSGGILITIHRLSHGGADRVAMHLANGFARAGFPVGIAVLRDGGEGEEALLALLDPNVRVGHAGRPMGSRHLELIRGRKYLRSLADTSIPALVLASSNNMGLVTGLSRRNHTASPAYVMKFTNPVIRPEDRTRLKRYYRRHLYGLVFANFDRVLALSTEECATLAKLYPGRCGKFRVATNPYVTSEMLEPTAGVASAVPTIVSLTRLMPQKRIDILIRAFARMGDPNRQLTIVGDGPERSRLEALAQMLGIADRVSMPGFMEDPMPVLRGADLLALSSDYEGLPAVVFEALACNVPVVTTNSFEAACSVLDGVPRSAVVPLGDVDALARAMDSSLRARGRAVDLRSHARPYDFGAAINSHLDALRPYLEEPRR